MLLLNDGHRISTIAIVQKEFFVKYYSIAFAILPSIAGGLALELANDLRKSLDNFGHLHMDFFSTKEYIEQKGGVKRIDKFVLKGVDPGRRGLVITSWAKFGVYDVVFGESKPFFFMPLSDFPVPWISSIVEGFSNDGLLYSADLPTKLAKKLMQEDNLNKIHKYRDDKEVMPELAGKLGWLL